MRVVPDPRGPRRAPRPWGRRPQPHERWGGDGARGSGSKSVNALGRSLDTDESANAVVDKLVDGPGAEGDELMQTIVPGAASTQLSGRRLSPASKLGILATTIRRCLT